MSVRVSVTLPQFRDDAAPMLEAARRAEYLGFDGVYVFDHLFPLGAPARPIFEGFTALGAVAAVTSRITVGTLVVRAPIRPAWTTAKAAWTAQVVSGGRLTLGIGAADSMSKAEFEAYGVPFEGAAKRIDRVRATVEALHAPQLAVPGFDRPKVWVGGRSKSVRDLAAEVADGWNRWGGDPASLVAEAADIRAVAARPFEVSWGGQVLVAPDEESVDRRLAERGGGDAVVAGTPGAVVDQLAAFASAGLDEMVLSLLPSPDWDSWELFCDEVRPRL